MTDQRHQEEEQVHRLLAAAAELPGYTPAPPGADFTARARRMLARRRLGAVAGAAVVVMAGAGATAVYRGAADDGHRLAAASAQCLRTTVQNLQDGRQAGFQAVYGQVREGGVDVDDGTTQGSAFRFDIDGTLMPGGGVPSSGPVLTWYPVSEAQLPPPGRYVLLLAELGGPSQDGRRLFEFRPEDVLPVGGDGRVRLTCEDGGTGGVEQERLRAALAGPNPAANSGRP
ncbi:hypothetical protein [Streptomyces lateritius]|uniref:hypothetical protein n=1 Tax=Streptomyces lateritius TaxID=67313 RepID=UPI001C8BAD9B|nr:hypothetical protein [Streptomyces lateritius]MBX9426811.1 hypothetical protein [Streptomyces lateritius]